MSGRKILLTCTSHPPAIGGARRSAHHLATKLAADGRYAPEVVAQWGENRTDRLLGTSRRAPPPHANSMASRFARSVLAVARTALTVLTYYPAKRRSVGQVSDVTLEDLARGCVGTALLQNVRIGCGPGD